MGKLTDEQLKSVKEGQGKINSILVEKRRVWRHNCKLG